MVIPVVNYHTMYDDHSSNADGCYVTVYRHSGIHVGNVPPITPATLYDLIYSCSTPHLSSGFALLGINGIIKYFHWLEKFL